jgi:hypothetical protein
MTGIAPDHTNRETLQPGRSPTAIAERLNAQGHASLRGSGGTGPAFGGLRDRFDAEAEGAAA